MQDKDLLSKIQKQIPEFDAEQNDGTWIWTFRCDEQQEGSDSLIECFIDFAAKSVDIADTMTEDEDEEDEDLEDCDYPQIDATDLFSL